MPRDTTAPGPGEIHGAGRHDRIIDTVPRYAAPEDLARELARRSDWRQAVEDLDLPAREARALLIAVVRCRAFGRRRR